MNLSDRIWSSIGVHTDAAFGKIGVRYDGLAHPKHMALEVCSAVLLLLIAGLLVAAARSAVRARHG